MFVKLLVLCSTILHVWCIDQIVEISTGKVRGIEAHTIGQNKRYYAFKGIRYAENPERFERSTPAKSWDNEYDATYDKAVCIQIVTSTNKNENENEDCLFISVYTPTLDINANLTVMFWIHGGAFAIGDSTYESYGPDYLLDEQNVVFVSLNYRLGALGFLSSGDAKLPGNNGIKDVILGLKWVQKNIAVFGGDPKKVTIFGESAGGAMSSILIQAPTTIGKGYFQRGILQSGNSLNPWSLQRNPLQVFDLFASFSSCYSLFGGFNASLGCLKKQNVNVLKLASTAITEALALHNLNILNSIAFAPTLEPASNHAVLVQGSYDFLSQKKYPNVTVLIGGTSEEALTSRSRLFKPLFLQIDLNPGVLVPEDMHASRDDLYNKIAPQLRYFYFQNSSVQLSPDEHIIRYLSDVAYNKPLREILTLLKQQTSVYCYVLSYYDELEESADDYKGLGKATHTSDLQYIFNSNKTFSEKSMLNRMRMIKLWTNFAVYGNPTPEATPLLNNIRWPIANQNGTEVKCVDIGNELTIIDDPFNKSYQMWKGLYDSYGHPRDTYK